MKPKSKAKTCWAIKWNNGTWLALESFTESMMKGLIVDQKAKVVKVRIKEIK